MTFVGSGLLSACARACVCACAEGRGCVRQGFIFRMPTNLLQGFGLFLLPATLAIYLRRPCLCRNCHRCFNTQDPLAMKAQKGYPFTVDTPRPELYVSLSMAVPCQTNFNATPKLLVIFASKDTLSLMPTFLGRTVQARGEEFVKKLLGGGDRSIIDIVVSKQFAW
jgi:hypothetical protein